LAQDTLKNFHPNGNISEIYVLKNNVRDGLARFYDTEGHLLKEVPYTSGRVDGVVKTYYPDGSVNLSFQVEEGRKNGSFEKFDSLGSVEQKLNFYKGAILELTPVQEPQPEPDSLLAVKYNLSLIKLSKEETALLGSYAPKIPPNDPAIYTFYDEPASFLNGEDEFYSRLFYPSRAIEDGLEGTVIIRALIRTDGTVESTEVAQPLGLGCEGSAEVTVKYTLFNPAKIKGRPVNAWVDIPVVFKLPNKN
jgi:TonB family C-terminal domain